MANVLIPKTTPIEKPPIDPAATVEQRMTGLLSKDSPYLQQAETYGKQEANAKGLLNSSMGIEAAESARIRAALPIAQQDAKTVSDSALSNQNYKQGQAQLGYQGEISSTLQGQQDDAALIRQGKQDDAALIRQVRQDDAALIRQGRQDGAALIRQREQDGAALIRQREQNGAALIRQREQDGAALIRQVRQDGAALIRQREQNGAALIRQREQDGAALIREKFSQEATTARTNLENDSKLRLASISLQQEDQKALQGTLASMGQQYEREYGAILVDTSFATPGDRTAALEKLARVYKSNANLAASVASVNLQWT